MYEIGVARCQLHINLIIASDFLITDHWSGLAKLYTYSSLNGLTKFTDEEYDFYCKKTVQIKRHLYTFSDDGEPIEVMKFENTIETASNKTKLKLCQ